MALAERLGATVNLSFSKDDPFDFCVAKTVNSPKYLLARARGVPTATPAWLRDSAAEGEFLPLEGLDVPRGYRPPPFAGLSVCVTGHSQDERAEIEKSVVAGGGAYASDLVKGVCTHLIAADTTSAKYAHASRWDGVCIVTEAWVRACVDEGCRVDEARFRAAPDSSRDASGRTSKRAASRNDDDNAARGGEDVSRAAEAPEPDDHPDVPWGSCYLLSTRVCLHGFEPDSEALRRARRAVRRAGAGTVSDPAKATHVVVRDDPPDGSLRALEAFADKTVHQSWLEACEARARVADEEPHLVAPSLFAAVAARGARERSAPRGERAETSSRRGAPDGAKALPRGLREAARGRADRAPEREPRPSPAPISAQHPAAASPSRRVPCAQAAVRAHVAHDDEGCGDLGLSGRGQHLPLDGHDSGGRGHGVRGAAVQARAEISYGLPLRGPPGHLHDTLLPPER